MSGGCVPVVGDTRPAFMTTGYPGDREFGESAYDVMCIGGITSNPGPVVSSPGLSDWGNV